jgi:hypothetical protein
MKKSKVFTAGVEIILSKMAAILFSGVDFTRQL